MLIAWRIRALDALERKGLTTDEFRNSPDVALILQAAQLLQSTGADFPPSSEGWLHRRHSSSAR
jgi:hypothetical protein